MTDLKDKVCVVTGAGRGIGYHFASALAENQCIVYGIDLHFPLEKEYSFEKMEKDLTCKSDISSIRNLISDKHGKLDVLVNNAGVTFPHEPVSEYPYDNWMKTFNVNVNVPFLLFKEFFPDLKNSQNPSVINITSLNSELAFPNNPAYVSSKSALSGLTRSLALDYGKYNIRVNSISPGYIKTDMTGESWHNKDKRRERSSRTMLGRWGTPEDLIGPLLFLASSASSYITGHSLFVDGGWRVKGL